MMMMKRLLPLLLLLASTTFAANTYRTHSLAQHVCDFLTDADCQAHDETHRQHVQRRKLFTTDSTGALPVLVLLVDWQGRASQKILPPRSDYEMQWNGVGTAIVGGRYGIMTVVGCMLLLCNC